MLEYHATQWNRLVGCMSSTSLPVKRKDLAPAPYLRLAVVDLAPRAAAAIHLTGLPCPDEGTPKWAIEGGKGLLLRELLDVCSENKPTGEVLAAELRVSDNTVDSWLGGKSRPSAASISAVSNCLEGDCEDPRF